MARLDAPLASRGQFAALARLQWQALINSSLRTTRGRLELVSRIVIAVAFAGFGFGGAVGLGVAAWYFAHSGQLEYLAVLLWPVFAFWQLFPLVATSFTESFDSTQFLRFPLSFRAYLLIRLVAGLFDPVTAVGGLWLLGIALGTAVARPALLPWTVLVLLVFAVFNVVLMQVVLAWTERWLAQRRTREILSVLLIAALVSLQFLGPLIDHFRRASPSHAGVMVIDVVQVQRLLPPGLAAGAVASAAGGALAAATTAAAGLAAFLLAAGWLLGLRLSAEYRGENLSESAAKTGPQKAPARRYTAWPSWGLPIPVAAVLEKEVRSLRRSPLLLFILAMPLVLLLLFRIMPGNGRAGDAFLAHRLALAFPVGTAYAILLLTSFSHNFLGGEGSGVQLLFALPVTFRRVALAKNLACTMLLALQMSAIWVAACLLYQPPSPAVTAATVAGVLFMLPLEFSAGNLLSVYSPKRVDYSRFGRQRASRVTVLAGLLLHAVLFGMVALTVFLASVSAGLWAAVPAFLVLTALGTPLYLFVLRRLDAITLGRREALIAELSRTDTR